MSDRAIAPHLTCVAAGRKDARQRMLLLSAAVLIFLSTSPILGHHVVSRAGSLIMNRDHLLGLCLVALQSLLSPVHEGFHLLLLVGLFYAALDRLRAARELNSVLACLDWESPKAGGMIERAAVRTGHPLGLIRVVKGLPNPAFTAGWWRPRVFLAADLERVLTEDELTAVIGHESAHARGRDPLRLSLFRFFAAALFYIPALKRLADDLADEAEIAADDRAAASEPAALASAILTLARFQSGNAQQTALPASAAVAGFQKRGLLERRVRRLVGEKTPARSHVTRRSLAGAFGTLVAIWISGLLVAHPLGANAPALAGLVVPPQHCQHHHVLPFSHIFCAGADGTAAAVRCAHSV